MYFRTRFLGLSLAVIGLVWMASSVSAQGNPLEMICQGFLSSSGAPAPGNATVLCGCLVREVQSNLTLSEMQSYQSSVEAGRPLSKAIETKIMTVAASCLTQAQ